MTAFKTHFEELHPRNRLIIEKVRGPDGKEHYVSSTMFIGPAIDIVDHRSSTRQLEIDGAHFKKPEWASKIPGLMRGIVATDADNRKNQRNMVILLRSHEKKHRCLMEKERKV